MATFKVGQRVKVISVSGWIAGAATPSPIDAEGIVVEVRAGCWDYIVDLPAFHHPATDLPATHWGFDAHHLAPLTDPSVDAFLERIRKLKPYDEPKADVQRRFLEKIESVVGPLGPRFK